MKEFFEAMTKYVPYNARIMLCQFRGDPEDDIKGKWRARTLRDPEQIDQLANVYLCVSAMKRNPKGEWRRRKENFMGGLLLMIDDLGDGPAAKFPLDIIQPLKPTALVETSPANFQAIYLFDRLETNRAKFEALIKAFIQAQFLGRDTGMAGVNRVFRPPAGVNGKTKHNGWKVRLAAWNPEKRYSIEEIATAFNLELQREGPRLVKTATVDRKEGVENFIAVRSVLRSAGMLKTEQADQAGWTNIRCPWTHEHSGGKDNGAAICLPNEQNGYTGAFKCFHGSCEKRGWRDLTEFVAEEVADVLDMINRNASKNLPRRVK